MEQQAQTEQDVDVNPVFDLFTQIELQLNKAKLSVAKNANGTVAAGVRVRKSMRETAKLCRALVKLTIARDKEIRESRPKRVRKPKAQEEQA